MNEEYKELTENCKVIYDDDNFAYIKCDDVEKYLSCGCWFDRLFESDKKVFKSI